MVLTRRRTHHEDQPGAQHRPVDAQPDTYERWRQTRLGSITQSHEVDVVFDLAGPLTSLRLLDVGCGDGLYLVEAARRGAVASGVDISEAMLAAARQRADDADVAADLHLGDAQTLPFDDGSFDLVLAITVLCFLPDAQQAIDEMSRVLVPGGRLVIGDLGRWNSWAAVRRVRGWLGSNTWRHATFRSAGQLVIMINDAGLQADEIRGAVYYPPLGILARAIAPIESHLGAVTTLGAAFLAVSASKPVH